MSTTAAEEKAEAVKAALLYESFLSKVRVIRERRGGNIADVVDRFGGPGIDKEYRKVLAEMQAETEGRR